MILKKITVIWIVLLIISMFQVHGLMTEIHYNIESITMPARGGLLHDDVNTEFRLDTGHSNRRVTFQLIDSSQNAIVNQDGGRYLDHTDQGVILVDLDPNEIYTLRVNITPRYHSSGLDLHAADCQYYGNAQYYLEVDYKRTATSYSNSDCEDISYDDYIPVTPNCGEENVCFDLEQIQ